VVIGRLQQGLSQSREGRQETLQGGFAEQAATTPQGGLSLRSEAALQRGFSWRPLRKAL